MNYAQPGELGSLKSFLQKTFTPVKYAQAQTAASKVTSIINDVKSAFNPSASTQPMTDNNGLPVETQDPASLTKKILIGAGIATALGTLIYFATRKKSKTKK